MSVGHVLAGRYTVGEVIGRGGMADVRVGRDLWTGRSVAIKALRSTVAEDPLVRSSLGREAQMLGRVRHDAIVALVDAGHEDGGGSVDAPGASYIVMEYVAGRSLRDLLRAGELTPETSVRYLLGVLSALEASHRAGVVHRDIKPANVMVTPTGAVKLVDFGIARASSDPTATVSSTVGTGYDYDTVATDLDAVLTILDLRDVVLVGFSICTRELARYIATYGTERIAKLAFLASLEEQAAHWDEAVDDVGVQSVGPGTVSVQRAGQPVLGHQELHEQCHPRPQGRRRRRALREQPRERWGRRLLGPAPRRNGPRPARRTRHHKRRQRTHGRGGTPECSAGWGGAIRGSSPGR